MDGEHSEISRLFDRVAAGDREALQHFMTRYGERLRRRIKGTLLAESVGDGDIDDIESSTRRRADEALLHSKIAAGCPDALRDYVLELAERRAREAARQERRLQKALGKLEIAAPDAVLPDASDAPAIETIMSRLKPAEFEMVQLRGRGCAHDEIARRLGISVEAQRKRLSRLRDKVVTMLAYARRA